MAGFTSVPPYHNYHFGLDTILDPLTFLVLDAGASSRMACVLAAGEVLDDRACAPKHGVSHLSEIRHEN